MIDGNDYWARRFHRDDSAWVRDPKVFIDRGRAMPEGPPPLKERRPFGRRQRSSYGDPFRKRGGASQTLSEVLLLNPEMFGNP